MHHAHVVNPDFYSTAATVNVAVYIALAIELRLLEPRKVEWPEDRKARFSRAADILFIGSFLIASLVGIFASLAALYSGSDATWAALTSVGLAATFVLFGLASLGVVFQAAGVFVPRSAKRIWRPLAIISGLALMGYGIYLIVANS